MNKVILIGRLGKDPELRSTQGGQQVATFSLATTEKYTQNGQKQEHTEWHNIVAWGKQAELVTKYLTKGSMLSVIGKIRTREWSDNSGNKRSTKDIVLSEMEFLGGSKKQNNATQYSQQPQQPQQPQPQQQTMWPQDDTLPF